MEVELAARERDLLTLRDRDARAEVDDESEVLEPLAGQTRGRRRDGRLAGAGTVHLGGTLEEMIASERAIHEGRVAERPYVLVAQQSLVDPTRAPAGQRAPASPSRRR